MADRNTLTDWLMRQFLPNTYGEPAQGAPNPFTPPLWRDQRNPDDPLNRPRKLPDDELMDRAPWRVPSDASTGDLSSHVPPEPEDPAEVARERMRGRR